MAKKILGSCKSFNQEMLESLKAVLAHAEQMTMELEQTDDLTEFPYIQRARSIIKRAKKRK